MIRVSSLSVLVFIYLFVFLALVFFIWILSDMKRKRREKLARRYRLGCTMCALEFEDSSDTLLPRCPRCGSLNERFKLGVL